RKREHEYRNTDTRDGKNEVRERLVWLKPKHSPRLSCPLLRRGRGQSAQPCRYTGNVAGEILICLIDQPRPLHCDSLRSLCQSTTRAQLGRVSYQCGSGRSTEEVGRYP